MLERVMAARAGAGGKQEQTHGEQSHIYNNGRMDEGPTTTGFEIAAAG